MVPRFPHGILTVLSRLDGFDLWGNFFCFVSHAFPRQGKSWEGEKGAVVKTYPLFRTAERVVVCAHDVLAMQ